jgi:thioredoxin 1
MTRLLSPAELDTLLAEGGAVVVDFFGTWCQPCKMMAPAVDRLAEVLLGRVEVVKVDIEEGHKAASKFGVRSVPTFIVFKQGKPVASRSGVMPHQNFIDWASAQSA